MTELESTASCAVAGCPNNSGPIGDRELSYFSFPKDPFLRNLWVRSCLRSRNWQVTDSSRVCSDHFDCEDFDFSEQPNGDTLATLKSDAIPTSQIRMSIKAEPIDVEEEFGDVLGNDENQVETNTDDGLHSDSSEMDRELNPEENGFERYSCNTCGREFRTRIRLKRHVLFCQPHNKSKNTSDVRPRSSGTTCLYENCNAKFYHRNRMLKHMAAAHNYATNETKSFVFPTMEHFWTWKETEEEKTYSYFSKRTGNHKNTATYQCQRDGPPRTKKSASDDPRSKRQTSRGSIKANIVCLAYIKTTLNEDGSVSVLYFPSHNHPLSAMDFLHHPLSRATQLFIKEKLELGYTPKQIADELLTRQNASGQASSNNMTKNQFLHMVNKLDRIRGFLDRERKRVRDESSGQTQPRVRKSRKVVLEEQFEKSRQFLKQSKASGLDEKREVGKTESTGEKLVSSWQASADEGSNVIASDDESNADDETVQQTTADVGSWADDANDYCDMIDEPEIQNDIHELPSSSGHQRKAENSDKKDYEKLYGNLLLENGKLVETVASLKKQVVKKDRQINLLINALKRSLSKDGGDDLASVIDTVSDGDYQIVVI